MSTAKRVIKNTGYLYAKMGITMFISLYTTRLVLNALGASDFGIFNIVGGAIAMLGFLNAAMAGATQRFMSYAEGEGDKEKQKKIFNISFILHLAVGLLLGMILILVGFIFFNGILNIPADRIFAAKAIYGSLIISTVFTVITVPYDAVLNARENMLYYAIVGIIESFLKLGAAWAVVLYAGDKLILYGILMACVPIITLTIMRIYCHRKYEECTIAPKKYWDKKLSKEMRNFAGWNLLGIATGMTSQYGLGIVLNVFFGPILNAAQGIANQISGQLMAFSNTMLKAVNNVISKSVGSGNKEIAVKTSFTSAKFSFFLFSFFAIPFIIETPYILKIWLSKIPDWTILFCRLQLIRILIELVTLSIAYNIYAVGNIKAYTKTKSFINISPILLTIIMFYYKFPPYTMYIVWILCWNIIGGYVILFYAKKNVGISLSEYFKAVLFPCILTSSIIFTSTFGFTYLFSQGIIRLFFIIIISSLLHFVIVWNLGMNDYEKKIFVSIKDKILKNIHLT